MEQFGKVIFGLGVVCVIIGGALWFAADKLSWLGRLPGDITVERPGFRFYAPITTMILLSIVLSVLSWLFGRFFK